jgi:hypothetical protein
MNPFCAKTLKLNYNVVPYYGEHGTERVNALLHLGKLSVLLAFHSILKNPDAQVQEITIGAMTGKG